MSWVKLRGVMFFWGPLVLSFVLTFWGLGGGMRESDQGALLHGSLEMARGGGSLFGGEYYRLEKQYISYWMLVAAIKLSGAGLGEDVGKAADDLVLLGNAMSWVVLWMGLLFLVWRGVCAGRVPSRYVGAVLLSPVFLLCSWFLTRRGSFCPEPAHKDREPVKKPRDTRCATTNRAVVFVARTLRNSCD
ncbi:MAG: hypothetical protein AAGD22_16590 [Verrucomicrobiota bacterium]